MGIQSIWLNLVVFAVSGAAIWWAGVRLEHHVDVLAKRTRMGNAFAGMLLLAAATSLPEVATTITAVAVLNDATLAVNNLLGGVALQTALLIVADATTRRRGALTSFDPQFQLLIQGVGLMLLLCIVIGGVTANGAPTVAGVSAWLVALFFAYLAVVRIVYKSRSAPRWSPGDVVAHESADQPNSSDRSPGGSTRRHWIAFSAFSLLVLVGGWFATHAADGVAKQSGLGSAFVGATLLALATSLPELSTTTAAVRRNRYSTAISNVFGSNAFDVVLLLLADLLFRRGTILEKADDSAMFVAVIGAMMTCIYLLGMLERRDKTVARLGWDSVAALLVYAAGMAVLYTMS